MDGAELVMLFTVLFVCGLAAWPGRNLTAAALAGGYAIGEVACLAGLFDGWDFDRLAGTLFMIDITVVALIVAKTLNACRDKEYDGWWHHIRCLYSDHTIYDRIILAIFVLGVWPTYVLNIDASHRFWMLWLLAMVQYLLSGAEVLPKLWRRAKARVADPDNPSSGSLRAAWAGIGQWST